VQGGAYGEHQIVSAKLNDKLVSLGGSPMSVQLGPGCGATLTLKMKRHANQPTLSLPWATN